MMLSRYARAIKQYVSFRLAPRADHADDVVHDMPQELTDFALWTPLDNQDERRMLLLVARGKNVYARQAK